MGCGAIGCGLSSIIAEKLKRNVSIVALHDIDTGKAQKLSDKLGCAKPVSLEELINLSSLVVEAASGKASFDIAKKSLCAKKDCLIMSIGGVLGKEKELFEIADRNGARIYFPSGAICGIDGVESLRVAGIDELSLNTYKPPKALEGADYLVDRGIDLSLIQGQEVIFSGTALEAVKAFPKNINIVALLSIAAGGQVVPRVNIYVSPGLERNVHVIEVKSKAGRIEIRCENVPCPDNPKTSFMAVLSAVAVISRIAGVS